MEKFIVQGGAVLRGAVRVSGSKNAALPIMAASLAIPGPVTLSNVPDLVDVRTLAQVLTSLGAKVDRLPNGDLNIEVCHESANVADYELVRRMRASVCVLGPLLARRGEACVSLPGGCNIGHRPIDLHLKGLAALGAEIQVRNGYVHARAHRLRGAMIYLAGPHGSTVTGTCNVMTAAALARGTTVIDAAACEPEVIALADFLNQAGARISGQGTSRIVIEGVEELRPTAFSIIPDRIEAATLMIAAVMTRGTVELSNVIPSHLNAPIDILTSIGARVELTSVPTRSAPAIPPAVAMNSVSGREADANSVRMRIDVPGELLPFEVTALPYPGIPTDIQAQLMALACTIPGTSLIRDHVFPDRFIHVAELIRMGACIRHQGSSAMITGTHRLTGANVMASDLRASAALVLAGLAADGESVIHRIYHLDRGYESLEFKLQRLGANVIRAVDEKSALPSTRMSPVETLPLKKTA